MYKLVLLRHGESVWNKENRFTGWTDVDLSPHGEEEAREAARLLGEGGYTFDVDFAAQSIQLIRPVDCQDRNFIALFNGDCFVIRHKNVRQAVSLSLRIEYFIEQTVC